MRDPWKLYPEIRDRLIACSEAGLSQTAAAIDRHTLVSWLAHGRDLLPQYDGIPDEKCPELVRLVRGWQQAPPSVLLEARSIILRQMRGPDTPAAAKAAIAVEKWHPHVLAPDEPDTPTAPDPVKMLDFLRAGLIAYGLDPDAILPQAPR